MDKSCSLCCIWQVFSKDKLEDATCSPLNNVLVVIMFLVVVELLGISHCAKSDCASDDMVKSSHL